MRILGIDPGYALMGWSIVDYKKNKFSLIKFGCIDTPAGMPMPMRLSEIYKGINDVIDEYGPDVASIEELYFQNNAKTAIYVGQARGVAILACYNHGLEINEYTPLQIKQSVSGYGNADKKQVQEMVKIILHLDKIPKPDDAADAVAAAICCGNQAGGSLKKKVELAYKNQR